VKPSKAAAISDPATTMSDPALHVRGDLERVEAKLAGLLDSKEVLLSEISHYLIDGAGKRLRPLFILLVYRACGGTDHQAEDAIDAAIALELIHSATLLHDDIIDTGMLRRGKPSAYAQYGPTASLVAGDYLFCRAFELCGRFDERLVRIAARACIELTEGEVMEGRMRHQTSATLDDYLTVITRKTASLFAAGGRVAADLAGAAQSLLDITGPEEKIGKPVGSDLRAGVPSLPVVIGMRDIPELRAIFINGTEPDEAVFAHALELMRQPPVMRRAQAMIAAQLAKARALLDRLEPSAFRDGLTLLIADQIDRDS
jgi:heptaprenyl diphosphate synthase